MFLNTVIKFEAVSSSQTKLFVNILVVYMYYLQQNLYINMAFSQFNVQQKYKKNMFSAVF